MSKQTEAPGQTPEQLPRVAREDIESNYGGACYRGSIPLDQLPFPDPPNEEDFDWAFNDPDVRRQYCGLIVAVSDRRVWGAGKDSRTAWEDARKKPGCPEASKLVFVPVCAPASDNRHDERNPRQ
jgi:hypothetical protein